MPIRGNKRIFFLVFFMCHLDILSTGTKMEEMKLLIRRLVYVYELLIKNLLTVHYVNDLYLLADLQCQIDLLYILLFICLICLVYNFTTLLLVHVRACSIALLQRYVSDFNLDFVTEFFLFIRVPLYKVFLVTLCFIQAKMLCIMLIFVLSVLLKWCPDEIAYKQYKFW